LSEIRQHFSKTNNGRQWALVDDYVDYKYSSAKFYEMGQDDFGFLTHYQARI
jgi:hypothetical protein